MWVKPYSVGKMAIVSVDDRGRLTIPKELGVRSSFYFLKETGKVEIFNERTWRHLG